MSADIEAIRARLRDTFTYPEDDADLYIQDVSALLGEVDRLTAEVAMERECGERCSVRELEYATKCDVLTEALQRILWIADDAMKDECNGQVGASYLRVVVRAALEEGPK